ncbi:methyltransferase domain-containing protein [Nonomuraea sp. PA05]|uniref:methyltransferase domain-containing protein n=1 Tax=Nonomuraea sp. PA05 TaxID=2604466 RepID=UPI001651B7F5|nr:methyltransferase domain-containing protein [Nonomuraea sp. PA05]
MDFAAQRHALVAQLRTSQDVSEPVAEAMLAVPRHLFVPGVEPEAAYRDEPIVTKLDDDGRPISSSSQPAIMATMLDQLRVAPGHRVLEIGAGTGYNAALLSRLVGPGGRVVALDLDEDTVEQARQHLAAAGVSGVEVVCRDGAGGHPGLAPYDRLIATVGVWDLAPAWLAQLGPDGRLVVPLDLRGVQVSAAMERDGGRWVSRSVAPCGFMRMRGSFTGTEAVAVVRQDPFLALVLPEQREVGDVLAALNAPPTEITVRRAEKAASLTVAMGMALWLALHEPRWCAVSGDLGGGPGFTAGIVQPDGIAVLSVDGSLVARGHGAGRARLAAELAAHVKAWDEAGRPEASALHIAAYPHAPGLGEPAVHESGAWSGRTVVIEKRHTTLVLGFG